MNIKKIALLVVLSSLGLYMLAINYGVPIAYVPYGASQIQFVVSHVIFVTAEAYIFTFLFIYMIKKSNLEFHNGLTHIFK